MPRFQVLDAADLDRVSRLQSAQQQTWRELPPDGRSVACCGEAFTVLPNVFPPRSDTQLLMESLTLPPGAAVLDMGTGSGALAVLAVLGGAGSALAVDINPDAVRNAALNADRHGLGEVVEARHSDGFTAIDESERFDVIIANLPGRNATARDLVQAAQWDTGFKTHKAFFSQAPHHLATGGQVVMTKANYPELNDVVALAEAAGFGVEVLAERGPTGEDPRTYYALAFGRGPNSCDSLTGVSSRNRGVGK